jgi:Zn-dependent peptidase ImmA (M78 family)
MKDRHYSPDFLRNEDIWARAEEVRRDYWPDNSLPVESDLIVEQIGLQVVPTPLPVKFDAFLALNAREIYIDLGTYRDERYENRLRFSFAHELGHYILHRELMSAIDVTTVDEYQRLWEGIHEDDYRSCEYQANEFAGRLLVPVEELRQELKVQIRNLSEPLTRIRELIDTFPDDIRLRLSSRINRKFGVSSEVIAKRLLRERIWPPEL